MTFDSKSGRELATNKDFGHESGLPEVIG
jgi:hypothetical protein